MTTADLLTPADAWLGRGLRFPFTPPDGGGAMPTVAGMDRVRQAIEVILSTEPGERIMMPTFGCGLRRLLMQPNTVATRASIEQDVDRGADPSASPGSGSRRSRYSRTTTPRSCGSTSPTCG